MKLSEDDKWYIADTAQTVLPALIQALNPPVLSGPERVGYAKDLGMLAHLIGLQMFNAREQMFASIEKASPVKKDDAPAS